MKIKINIEELKEAVSEMGSVMKGNNLSILECLLLSAENCVITLTANNLNIQVSTRISGDVLLDGRGLLHRDDLALLLKMKNDVELEFDNNVCYARGSRLLKLAVTSDVKEFPVLPDVPEDIPNFTIPENELLNCMKLKKLTDAASDKNLELRGIWFEGNNIFACDGYRLGKIETEHYAEEKFMLTDCALNYLTKALDKKSDAPVVFYIADKKYVKARAESFELIYRPYDANFTLNPDMFNTDEAKTAVIRKESLSNAIGFMCDVYKSSNKGRWRPTQAVEYSFNGNKLKLAFLSGGKYAEEEIPVDLSGEIDFPIGFQPLLYSELLSMIDGKDITMSFRSPLAPSVVFGEKETEKYIILPVRNREAA